MNITSPQVHVPEMRGDRAQGKRANRKVVPETTDPHPRACRNFHGGAMFSCRPGGADLEQTVEMGEKIPFGTTADRGLLHTQYAHRQRQPGAFFMRLTAGKDERDGITGPP
ncbi:MAG TPA: hypothetical protein VJ747_16390 [Stellaceae bacterium]|nr:hypothetical protein [Stellaceae bacterium]